MLRPDVEIALLIVLHATIILTVAAAHCCPTLFARYAAPILRALGIMQPKAPEPPAGDPGAATGAGPANTLPQ